MMQFLFWLGILFVGLGVFLLMRMGLMSRKLNEMDEAERQAHGQKLLIMNFSGLGLGILGLMMVLLSSILG